MSQLNVFMNSILVGRLTKNRSGGLSFIYDRDWLSHESTRPISLSIPLSEQVYTGDLIYNFFDNLLPDNQQIRSRIQAMFQAKTSQPFDLLASIGRDCVGALQLTASESVDVGKVDAERLTEDQIGHVLKNFTSEPLGMSGYENGFRISIAGAQEKTAFLFHQNNWHRPLGAIPTSHIFKLPIGMIEHQSMDLRDSCENEWLCSKIASAFGMSVAKTEIAYFEGVKALIVERFDRKWNKDGSILLRLPQEDLCQSLAFSPNLKYQSDGGPGILDIMGLLHGSKNPDQDREMFFRSQILFYLLAAIDGHAKNFSVFIDAHGRYRLTPLYDIMSAYPLIAKRQLEKNKIKMAMALIGENKHYLWHGIQRRHFLSTAVAAGFSAQKAENFIDGMLSKVDQVIEKVSNNLPENFPQDLADSVFLGMQEAKRKLQS